MDVKGAEQRLPTARRCGETAETYFESQDMNGEQPGFMEDAGGITDPIQAEEY